MSHSGKVSEQLQNDKQSCSLSFTDGVSSNVTSTCLFASKATFMNSHVLSPHNRTAFCTRHEKDNYIIQGLVLLSRRPVRWRNEKERNVWIVNRLCPAPLPASACVDVTINPEAVSLFLGQDSSQTPSLLLPLSWAAEGRAERGERQTWEVHSDLRYRHQQQKRVRSPTC